MTKRYDPDEDRILENRVKVSEYMRDELNLKYSDIIVICGSLTVNCLITLCQGQRDKARILLERLHEIIDQDCADKLAAVEKEGLTF